MTTTTERRLNRVIRRPEIYAYAGVKKSKLEQLIKDGKFPKPIKMSEGGRAEGWFEDTLIDYQEKLRAKAAEVA
jgi:predicted DNA-binding transcriptional regulator AlpA